MRYRVNLLTYASTTREVEADSREEAIEKVFTEGDLPYASGFSDYEFGEWDVPSALIPDADPANDAEEA